MADPTAVCSRSTANAPRKNGANDTIAIIECSCEEYKGWAALQYARQTRRYRKQRQARRAQKKGWQCNCHPNITVPKQLPSSVVPAVTELVQCTNWKL